LILLHTSGSMRPASHVRPMPHERLPKLSHGLREIRVTAPPRVDRLRMGDA
jgi:hypothetical protein